MPLTTKDEVPSEALPAKTGIEKEVFERYNKGENLYQIAKAVYDFDSEEAIQRIASILGLFSKPETKLLDD